MLTIITRMGGGSAVAYFLNGEAILSQKCKMFADFWAETLTGGEISYKIDKMRASVTTPTRMVCANNLTPIGLLYAGGVYRAFFSAQFDRPVVTEWESETLVDWRLVGTPIVGSRADKQFGTGSLLCKNGIHYLVYDVHTLFGSEQRLAVLRDGREFLPHPIPVLKEKAYQTRVVYANNQYQMFARSKKLGGGLCAYVSENLINWQQMGMVANAQEMGRYPQVVALAGGNIFVREVEGGVAITPCVFDLASYQLECYGETHLLKGLRAPRAITLPDGRVRLLAVLLGSKQTVAAPVLELGFGKNGLTVQPASEMRAARTALEQGIEEKEVSLPLPKGDGELVVLARLGKSAHLSVRALGITVQVEPSGRISVNGTKFEVGGSPNIKIRFLLLGQTIYVFAKGTAVFWHEQANMAQHFAASLTGEGEMKCYRYDWGNKADNKGERHGTSEL